MRFTRICNVELLFGDDWNNVRLVYMGFLLRQSFVWLYVNFIWTRERTSVFIEHWCARYNLARERAKEVRRTHNRKRCAVACFALIFTLICDKCNRCWAIYLNRIEDVEHDSQSVNSDNWIARLQDNRNVLHALSLSLFLFSLTLSAFCTLSALANAKMHTFKCSVLHLKNITIKCVKLKIC